MATGAPSFVAVDMTRKKHGPGLHRRFAQDDARRQRKAGVMPRVPEFIAGERLAADDPSRFLRDDFVKQKKRIAMRDGRFNGVEVKT